ncbi:MAG TPA: cupin domain-containing protein [Chloroflexota bacterium]|nr:cupin domain-containing protein [Chloroflexota bacterium]
MIQSAPPGIVATASPANTKTFDWGTISWLFTGESAPGAEQTLGYVIIQPGQKNPLHAHPNCEEVLYLLSGELEHSLDGAVYRLKPGDAIRVPAGAKHDARNVTDQPAAMVVCYSDPARQMVDYETPAGQAPRE